MDKEKEEEETSSRRKGDEKDEVLMTSYVGPLFHEIHSFRTSFASKASPIFLKSWIAMVLTLDGRDKVTKVIQYSSRLLVHYYKSMANRHGATFTALYLSKAARFANLQRSLTSSRKAYRFGRSIIEFEKLNAIGLVHWISWHLRNVLFPHQDHEEECSSISSYESDSNTANSPRQESTVRWHEDTKFDADSKLKSKPASQDHAPRIHLPRRVSSNLGPSTIVLSKEPVIEKRPYRQLSSMGRLVYLSLSSFIDQKRESDIQPMWKILSSTFKLLGLAGFWAADNVSFLYSSGFLDHHDNKKTRTKSASIFAARSYFFASVSGLYLNYMEWIRYRNGLLKETWENLIEFQKNMKSDQVLNSKNSAYEDHEMKAELDRLKHEVEKARRRYASLCIALVKSCCDVLVFSNNTGIDFHLKYRGKKMNEYLHCACGITSAMTVIYNNFPSTK